MIRMSVPLFIAQIISDWSNARNLELL